MKKNWRRKRIRRNVKEVEEEEENKRKKVIHKRRKKWAGWRGKGRPVTVRDRGTWKEGKKQEASPSSFTVPAGVVSPDRIINYHRSWQSFGRYLVMATKDAERKPRTPCTLPPRPVGFWEHTDFFFFADGYYFYDTGVAQSCRFSSWVRDPVLTTIWRSSTIPHHRKKGLVVLVREWS